MRNTAIVRKHRQASVHSITPPLVGAEMVTLPLARLVQSDLNVRKTDRDVGIAELARDIGENGLKQNLVVVPALAGDKYEVIAGDRRLQALRTLWDEGALTGQFAVPVLIEERDHARETSLSENLHRVALNPADELIAFQTIIGELEGEETARIAECARRFGKSVDYVAQRLRLAGLHPDILAALRAGTLTLPSAKAYALFADQGLQLQVFATEERRQYGTRHDPGTIRNAMKGKTYPSNIPQALYVGLIAYFAAGGRAETEMFFTADAGHEQLLDIQLLDQLAREKADAELPIRAKEDGFNFGLMQAGFHFDYSAWPKVPPGFVRAHRPLAELSKRDRTKAIGVYGLALDGSRLTCVGYFTPIVAVTQANRREAQEIAERNDAFVRTEAVRFQAARLAVRQFTGVPTPERAIWPAADELIEPIKLQEDGTYLVAVQYRVTTEELDQLRSEAELEVDRELAAVRDAGTDVGVDSGEALA